MRLRPLVYLHACAVIPECNCGDREWIVQTADGYMWSTMAGPDAFDSMADAIAYARTLHPDHPDVQPLPPPNPPLSLDSLRVAWPA